MHKRTKALEISKQVRNRVLERDKWCIVCGSPNGLPNAHYISRAQGGLGIEENIVTLCFECHYKMDHTTDRKKFEELVRGHLEKHYPSFTNELRCYKK